MTLSREELEQKLEELEKRIALLESQRPIINVYPQYYQVPNYQPQFTPMPNGTWPTTNPMPLTTC